MPARGPFAFVQFEFGFLLGPNDGRYLTRSGEDAPAERILVLSTLGAPQRRLLHRRRARPRRRPAEPAPVPTSRVTVIDARGVASREEAERWLEEAGKDPARRDREVTRAVGELNRLIRAHRAATADPHLREVRPDQAVALRLGHGSGEQVAEGRFAAAIDLPRTPPRVPRAARLSPQERVAAVLGGREDVLACEELVLRARADLDAGRPREAALQARVALESVLAELDEADLGPDGGPLRAARDRVAGAANAALGGDPPDAMAGSVADAVRRMETALRRRRAGRTR